MRGYPPTPSESPAPPASASFLLIFTMLTPACSECSLIELSGIGGHAEEGSYSFLSCVWKRNILLSGPHQADHLLVQPRSSGEASGPWLTSVGPLTCREVRAPSKLGKNSTLSLLTQPCPSPSRFQTTPDQGLETQEKAIRINTSLWRNGGPGSLSSGQVFEQQLDSVPGSENWGQATQRLVGERGDISVADQERARGPGGKGQCFL